MALSAIAATSIAAEYEFQAYAEVLETFVKLSCIFVYLSLYSYIFCAPETHDMYLLCNSSRKYVHRLDNCRYLYENTCTPLLYYQLSNLPLLSYQCNTCHAAKGTFQHLRPLLSITDERYFQLRGRALECLGSSRAYLYMHIHLYTFTI